MPPSFGPLRVVAEFGASRLRFGTVVAGVKAGVVSRAIDFNPIRAVNSAPVGTGRTEWKRTGYFDPAVLLVGDLADFVSNFRQILILAENKGDVEGAGMRESDDIQREPNIHAFFLTDQEGMRLAFGRETVWLRYRSGREKT